MNRRVVITGMGALSALGSTPEELWNGLLAGRSGIRRLQRFVDAGLLVTTGGEIMAISHERTDRDVMMANWAIGDALAGQDLNLQATAFVWSTGLDTFQGGPNGFEHRDAGACFASLAARFGGPKMMIATACASGTQAIGEGARLIKSGRVDACMTGGSSVMLTPFYLMGFSGLQAVAQDNGWDDPSEACRPFDRRRCGFALADGAGALLLESLDCARRRRASILAEVVGFGMSQDGFDFNRPPEDGAGAEICIKRALQDARLSPSDIHAINAHGTGTYIGDLAEATALRRVFGVKTPVSGAKGAIGHAMAAAGALEAVIAVKTCMTGIVPPTVNLSEVDEACELDHVLKEPRDAHVEHVMSVSFGMGGQNAAIILKRLSE